MWYFSWILGLGFAVVFAVLNAIWYEVGERDTRRVGAMSDAPED
jgi:cyd operon protein YbgT